MKTVEINKGNWTGDIGKVELFEDNVTFRVMDMKFKLVKPFNDKIAELYGLVPGEDFDIKSDDGEWDADQRLGMISYYKGWWSASDASSGCTRESKTDPRLAAAMLLWNII